MTEMRIWSATVTAPDGRVFDVRYLLTAEELAGLQAAGVVPAVDEVVSMRDVADAVVATFERDALMAYGGVLQ